MSPVTSTLSLKLGERETFGSLWDLLQSSARNNLTQTAFHSCQQSSYHLVHLLPEHKNDRQSDHLQWTYSQLLHAAETLGASLQDSGLEPGSKFAVFCPNTVEWAVLFWACASIGVIFAPLNSRLTERPRELCHVLENLQPDAIAVFDPKCIPVLEKECRNIINAQNSVFKLFLGSPATSIVDDWQKLHDLPNSSDNVSHSKSTLEDPSVILLTSGTTSLPKLCPLSSKNIISQSDGFWTMRRLQPSSKLVAFGPGFHIQTIWNTIMAWRAGAAVVFPSATYDAGAIVDTLNNLPCTHVSCTPSVMFSLMSQPHFSANGYENLQSLALGAERVTKDLIERCYEAFKPKEVVNGWGMTEGISILGADLEEAAAWRDRTLSIGHVMPNNDIRICHPESMQVVGNDNVGELHVSGPTVIPGYYSKGELYRTDSFYQEDGKTWFKTGDSVVMDQQGYVYFEGRYKDLIVRGGENINPSIIEACLNKIPGIEVSLDRENHRLTVNANTLQSQVIGINDLFASQTICAVLRVEQRHDENFDVKKEAQSRVLAELGPSFRLASIFLLSELGMESFPKTATGKMRKVDLVNAVQDAQPEQAEETVARSTQDVLIQIWQRVLGAETSEIQADTIVSQIADSLVILRFCFHAEQEIGTRITAADVLEHETPRQQARILDRENGPSRDLRSSVEEGQTTVVPSPDESWITDDMRNRVSQALTALGFDPNVDVESIYQTPTFMASSADARSCSTNFRWVWRPREDISQPQIYDALSHCLIRHANFRSIPIPLEDNTGRPRCLSVTVKPSRKLFDQMIQDSDPIDSAEQLYGKAWDLTLPFARLCEPPLRVQILPVQGSSRPGIVVSPRHIAFDAMAMSFFFDELNARLSGQAIKTVPVPYNVFADMYRLHRDGAIARASKYYQLEKLQQLRDVDDCLWPKLRGPGLMCGDDAGWWHADGTPGKPHERISLDAAAGFERGRLVAGKVKLPPLSVLKSEHNIEAFTIVKAAISIFNVEQTGQHRAVYNSTEAGRKWPFMEPWVQQHLPNIMNLAGPTMAFAFNFIDVDQHESAGKFMTRIAENQKLDTEHCHAPWTTIIAELGPLAQTLVNVARRQLLNWDSSEQSRAHEGEKFLERVDRAVMMDLGLMWNFGLTSPSEIAGFVIYDDVHLGHGEVTAALARVFEITQWLADPQNWESNLSGILLR